MLCDTSCLTSYDVGVADVVKERRLSVVNMSHHRYYWRARYEVCLVILLLSDGVLYLGADIFRLKAELLSHDVYRLCVESLVDTYHDADSHTGTDDLVYADVHHRGKLGNGNELSKLKSLALCALLSQLCLELFLNGFALLLTILSALLVL